MATKRKKASAKNILMEKIKNTVFSGQGLPIVLSFTIMGVLFVLFRMKAVELDYKISEANRSIEDALSENKDLNAMKANLLSVNNLRTMAKRYNLSQPKQEQIIVIQ